MPGRNEFITGKDLLKRWYRWDKTNPFYLAYDILKYDLTVIDRVENKGSEDELIIGIKPEKLTHILKKETETLKDRLFYIPEFTTVPTL